MSAHTQANMERKGIRTGIRTGAAACAAAFALVASIPSVAHHSFAAEFDSTKEIKASGEVAVLEWQNPHGWIHVSALEICERPGRQGRGGGSGDQPQPEWSCRPRRRPPCRRCRPCKRRCRHRRPLLPEACRSIHRCSGALISTAYINISFPLRQFP